LGEKWRCGAPITANQGKAEESERQAAEREDRPRDEQGDHRRADDGEHSAVEIAHAREGVLAGPPQGRL